MSLENKQIRWSLILHIKVFVLVFGLQIALTRWAVDTAAFGRFIFHISLAQSLAIVAGLGVPSAALRFISRHLAHRQGAEARHLAGRAYLLVALSDLVVAGLLCIGVWLVKGNISPAMLWASAMTPLLGLRFMNETWAKTQHRTTMTLAPGGILQPILIFASCAGLYGLNGGVASANELLAIAFGVMVLCAGGQAWWLYRTRIRFPVAKQNPDSLQEPPTYFTLRELLRVALPMLIVAGLGVAMSQCDVLMLNWLAGDASTGEYAVAVRLSWIVVLPLISVNLLAAPTYASLWELRSIEGMREKACEYSRFIFLGTVPISILLAVCGKVILSWHGEGYQASYVSMLILIVGQVVNAGVGSTALLLGMTGYQDVVAKVFAPCAIINVIANALLIPRWGPAGAAIATAVSLSLWNIALIWIIWRKLKLDTSWLNLLPGRMKRFDGQLPDFGA